MQDVRGDRLVGDRPRHACLPLDDEGIPLADARVVAIPPCGPRRRCGARLTGRLPGTASSDGGLRRPPLRAPRTSFPVQGAPRLSSQPGGATYNVSLSAQCGELEHACRSVSSNLLRRCNRSRIRHSCSRGLFRSWSRSPPHSWWAPLAWFWVWAVLVWQRVSHPHEVNPQRGEPG